MTDENTVAKLIKALEQIETRLERVNHFHNESTAEVVRSWELAVDVLALINSARADDAIDNTPEAEAILFYDQYRKSQLWQVGRFCPIHGNELQERTDGKVGCYECDWQCAANVLVLYGYKSNGEQS